METPKSTECLKPASDKVEQWEYCTICNNPGYLFEPLQSFGKTGWEAFAVISNGTTHTVYLKRRIN